MNTILTILMITVMTYEMPKLPYTNNALEPVISQQTIDYHYGKHLQTLSLSGSHGALRGVDPACGISGVRQRVNQNREERENNGRDDFGQ